MLRLSFVVVFAVTILVGQAELCAQSRSPIVADSLIREEEKVVVNGNPEVWRLQWKSPPEEAACGPQDPLGATTCPCGGFAYAENGQLDLVRMRNGKEIDRLELTPLFEQALSDQKGAIVPCGDHGSELEVDMALRTINGAIRAVRREFDCTDDGKRGRLLTKENR